MQKDKFSGRGGKFIDGDPLGDPIQIQKDITRDKYLEALGFTVLRFEKSFVFQEPEINHPGRESRSIIIPKSAIPATPPLKGGEAYLLIFQLITIVLVVEIFLRLTAMLSGGG